MLAGGLGGLAGDMLMHSLDTVKTRAQGDPHWPPKYSTFGNTYLTILREEGILRGLYGGVLPAAIGSFGGTCLFFGSYEWSKRFQVDRGVPEWLAYLNAGLFADLVASPFYVPTEVMKTRLQLQGRYSNPYFKSGYNYRSSWDAAKTIPKVEGWSALFYGYKATLYRDLPFSAFTFAFYEKERQAAIWWVGSKDIGLPLEVLVGGTAGGAAGILTCPLDVVKTKIQTQVNPAVLTQASTVSNNSVSASSNAAILPASRAGANSSTHNVTSGFQIRGVSTSSPPTSGSTKLQGTTRLSTSSVIKGLGIIYRTEGVGGWFRGVGPRALWTSTQSGTMLVLYQALLRRFADWSSLSPDD